MNQETLSRKEAIWLACRQKTCCVKRLVPVTGRDVWRIARALDVDPWTFLIFYETSSGPDTFLLGHDDVHYRLALADRTGRGASKSTPCIFLMRTRNGQRRCGLGALRPTVCRTYPVQSIDGLLCVAPNSICTCRRWALSDCDFEEERALLDELEDARDEYSAVLDGWNDYVLSTPVEQTFEFVDFCRVLLTMYDSVARNPELAGR